MTAYVAADTPARGNDARGRKPYLIQNTLDIAAQIVINGADYAALDTETMLNVPKGTVILSAGIEVITSASGTTATVDLGFTGGVVDKYVDGLDIIGASDGDFGSSPAAEAAQIMVATAADTIDLLFVTEAALTAGKLRVWAVCMDVNDIGNVEPLEAARDFA
jgi:hypothetical protein